MEPSTMRDLVSTSTGLSKRQIDEYFAVLAEVIAERLADGEKVEIPRVGTLKIQNHEKWTEGRSSPEFLLTPTRAARGVIDAGSARQEAPDEQDSAPPGRQD